MSDPTYLLDSSVLIALATPSHVFHSRANEWMSRRRPRFGTCPITQGALIRIAMRVGGLSFAESQAVLASILQHPDHRFVQDSTDYLSVNPNGIVGHQQVTDAYLAQLVRDQGLKLATLDRAQASLYADAVEYI